MWTPVRSVLTPGSENRGWDLMPVRTPERLGVGMPGTLGREVAVAAWPGRSPPAKTHRRKKVKPEQRDDDDGYVDYGTDDYGYLKPVLL